MAQLAPFEVCGSVNVPTDVALAAPAPRLNSCSVMGEAESSVDPVTVSMTRSPGVNDEMGSAKAVVAAAVMMHPINPVRYKSAALDTAISLLFIEP